MINLGYNYDCICVQHAKMALSARFSNEMVNLCLLRSGFNVVERRSVSEVTLFVDFHLSVVLEKPRQPSSDKNGRYKEGFPKTL